MTRWKQIVVHADMDAFYAAVEQLDDPTLVGRPVLVGPRTGRGVVLTASYEARPFGVGSAMPMARALARCPEAVVVPPRFERYSEVSAAIMATFREFSPRVEPLSLDEAFLDMTGAEHLFGPPDAMGRAVRAAVREATGGLSASVGVAATKYVAKVASGHAKPDGLTVVPADYARAWLAPQPVSRLWGAGPKTEARLRALGLERIGQVASADPEWLAAQLGQAGRHFHELANARDPRRVEGNRSARSMGSDRTLRADVSERAEIRAHLRRAADRIGRRLRAQGYLAGGVRVKLKTASFQVLSRQCTLPEATDVAGDLYAGARALADRFPPGTYRLVGLAAFGLVRAPATTQLSLLPDRPQAAALERVLDSLCRRFGDGAVRRARDLDGSTVLSNAPNLDALT